MASCSPSLGLEEHFLSLALNFLPSDLIASLSLWQEEAEVTSATSILLLSLSLLLSGHLVYCCFYNEFRQGQKSFLFQKPQDFC